MGIQVLAIRVLYPATQGGYGQPPLFRLARCESDTTVSSELPETHKFFRAILEALVSRVMVFPVRVFTKICIVCWNKKNKIPYKFSK